MPHSLFQILWSGVRQTGAWGLGLLLVSSLRGGEPGAGNRDVRVQGRMIQAGPARVDAVSGQVELRLPLGPALPGRIPMGIQWRYDSGSAGYTKAGVSPFIWPDVTESFSERKVVVRVNHADTSYYHTTSISSTTGRKWLSDRSVAAPSFLEGLTNPLYRVRVYADEGSSSHLVATRWYRLKTWPDGLVTEVDLGYQLAVVSGDLAMATDFTPNVSASLVTRLSNRWGDWVRITEEGRPLSRLRMESNLGHWVELSAVVPLPADGSFGQATYEVGNNLGLAKVSFTAEGSASGDTPGQLWPTCTQLGLKTLSDAVQGLRLTLVGASYGLESIALASGATYTFTYISTTAGNQATEGFAAEDSGAVKKGDWKGWEPVRHGSGLHTIGVFRKAVAQIQITSSVPGEQGGRVELTRAVPQPTGYNAAEGTITWSAKAHSTTILKYPNPVPTAGEPARFTRLIHAEPLDVYGRPGQDSVAQRQMLLFTYSAVVKEESGILENGVEVVRSRAISDAWTLRSPKNADGLIASGLPLFPAPTRVLSERPQGDGPTTVVEQVDWDGSQFSIQSTTTWAPGAAVPGLDSTGRPAAIPWRGVEVAEGITVSGPIQRTQRAVRAWNTDLARWQTQSGSESVGGAEYAALRGAAAVDLGTKTFAYDVFGRPEAVTGTTGPYTSTHLQTYGPDRPEVESTTRSLSGPNGVPLSGRVGETYQYTGLWRSGVQSRPDTRWATEERDGLGRITATQSPDGVRVTFEYDLLGRLWRSTRQAKGSVAALSTWTEWDPAGRWVRQHAPGHDGSDLITETRLSAFGATLATTSAKGTAAERTITAEYDGFGQKVRESLSTKPGATPRFKTWIYEPDGFLRQVKNTRGIVLSTMARPVWGTLDGLSGLLSSVQGYRGQPQQGLRDLLGQVARTKDPKGQITAMAYDAYGRLKEIKRGVQVRSYTYNEVGWLLSQTQPEQGTTTFSEHTLLGLPMRAMRGPVTATTVLYSEAEGGNREGLVRQVSTSGLGPAVARTLDYDGHRRLASLVESQANGAVTESYGYDDLGRAITKTLSDGDYAFTVAQSLDAFGKAVELRYPTGGGRGARSAVTRYDALHRPISQDFDGLTNVAALAYDQTMNGEEGERLAFANGATTTWQRNTHQELSRVIHGAASGMVEDAAVAWSEDGLMTARGGDEFQYDELGRLKLARVWGLRGERVEQGFGYDLSGNRTSVTSTALVGALPEEAATFSLNVGVDNRLPETTTEGVATGRDYNELGRLNRIWAVPGRSETLTTWTHDAEGRVVGQGGSQAEWAENYLLDGSGLRFRRVKRDGTVVYTVYGFNREPLSTFQKRPPAPPTAGTMSLSAAKKTGLRLSIEPGDGTDAEILQPAGPVTVQVGQNLYFEGEGIGTSFSWTFGDGTSATGKTATKAYASAGTYTARFTARRSGSPNTTASVAITVVAPAKPVIVTFTANPSAILQGQGSTLSWSVSGATSVALDQGLGAVSASGTLAVSPTTTTTYTLTATNAAGSVAAQATVTVNLPPPPQIESFTANPSLIEEGQGSTLTWSVTGAASLAINGAAVSGTSLAVNPNASANYTLVATNAGGSASATTTVTVRPKLTWVSDAVYGFGQLLLEKRGSQLLYQQGDHLGTPSVLTDANGAVVGRQKGLPFGERFLGTGEKSLRRFTNHEDGPQFPIHMQARMYLPSYGRFAEVDPAYDHSADGLNLYSYVSNNPVTSSDPDGMREMGGDRLSPSGNKLNLFDLQRWGGMEDLDAEFLGRSQSLEAQADAYFASVGPRAVIQTPGQPDIDLGPAWGNPYLRPKAEMPGIFRETWNGQSWERQQVSSVTTDHAAVNGILNDLNDASKLMGDHVRSRFGQGINEYTLIHVPTHGFFSDIFKAGLEKVNVNTAEATLVARALLRASEEGRNVKWIAHSRGGAVFAQAMQMLVSGGHTLKGQTVAFHGSASNPFVSRALASHLGVAFFGRGFFSHPLDPVANLVGMGTRNPFKLIGSIFIAPFLGFDAIRGPIHSQPYMGD